ncbi:MULTISPECIES: nucleoside deaminase [unclassified Glutamicibacter]|uniref:nucleoside deaminase n=1 Tax=unclassified Glutamicibacter TaxID=2627139 RepID=UPI0038136904
MLDPKMLQAAINQSLLALESNDSGPFGAVVVLDGKVVSAGYNSVVGSQDPTAHAEINAIRAAGQALGTFDLSQCELYTSCEPCPMCLGAIYWSRFEHVYYANTREEAAKIGFDDDFIYKELELPMSERKIPFTKVEDSGALRAFELWEAKSDKQEY